MSPWNIAGSEPLLQAQQESSGDSEGAVAIKEPTPVTACRGPVGRSRGGDHKYKESGCEGLSEAGRDGKAWGRQAGTGEVVQGHHGVGNPRVGDHMGGRMRRVRRAAVRVQGDSSSECLSLVDGG